jgi:CheY-like chemotaxis protein
LLQDLGFDVSTTQNGQEALDQFKKSKLYTFDYIFMDIMMPIKNSLEATREIRVLPRRDAKNVHILAMSANAFESDIQECIKASMDGHIAKPIDMELLKEKLAK